MKQLRTEDLLYDTVRAQGFSKDKCRIELKKLDENLMPKKTLDKFTYQRTVICAAKIIIFCRQRRIYEVHPIVRTRIFRRLSGSIAARSLHCRWG